MAHRIKQYRYYNDKSPSNQPTQLSSANVHSIVTIEGNEIVELPETEVDDSTQSQVTYITSAHYVSGDVFGACYPVLQLGIQSLPGTQFYLNESVDPITIGSTGIYELDLSTGAEVTKIQFSAPSMQTIKDNDTAFLIVDIIYDDGEE